jgi:hypothetical protein
MKTKQQHKYIKSTHTCDANVNIFVNNISRYNVRRYSLHV